MQRYAPILRHTIRLIGGLAVLLALGTAPVCQAQSTPAEPASDEAEAEQESTASYLASRGFYRRRASGVGWFATRSEPVMARSFKPSDVLRVAPGVRVIEEGVGALIVSSRTPGRCPLAVFVDGTYTTIRNVDVELSLEDLAAVEVYRGPTDIPVGFHAPGYDRTCGALLVWTRMGLGEEG